MAFLDGAPVGFVDRFYILRPVPSLTPPQNTHPNANTTPYPTNSSEAGFGCDHRCCFSSRVSVLQMPKNLYRRHCRVHMCWCMLGMSITTAPLSTETARKRYTVYISVGECHGVPETGCRVVGVGKRSPHGFRCPY